ncbi:MAG: protein-glutamate O-methyltransferase CheR [Sphingobium sp.]|nr:protein-glutamate O-methyltransferase CheR [Sphingobium sp.]
MSEASMRILSGLLEQRTGQILSEGRRWRVDTLLRPVIRAHGIEDMADLVDVVRSQPDGVLARASVNALLNNETRFFRDMAVFKMLGDSVLPALLADATANRKSDVLRFWCAGCSTGQEAYSLAMMLHPLLRHLPDIRFEIVATDISTDAIDRAVAGQFSQAEVQRGLPINHLLRWFEPVGEQWRVHDELRQMIRFEARNLFASSQPAGLYDLILCRNVLLYFTDDRQKQLLDSIAQRCAAGGHLLLGAGETVIGQNSNFRPSQQFRGFYQLASPSSV